MLFYLEEKLLSNQLQNLGVHASQKEMSFQLFDYGKAISSINFGCIELENSTSHSS